MNRHTVLLNAARTAAWALLFGGWLVLGALALRHGPAGWLMLAPLALWLASVAMAQRMLAQHRPEPWRLRWLLLLAGVAAAAGVAHGAWLLAAPAWGLLLVAASAVVRWRRPLAGAGAPSPRGPALLAAMAVAAVAGDPRTGVPLAAVPALLAVALALLVPAAASPTRGACRSSLFDCALGAAPWQAWRQPQARLHAVAALAMLPMMALLPWMAEACRGSAAEAGLGPRMLVALHLLAMLLPAWSPRPVPAAVVAGLLVGGGGVALALPGGSGAMWAMLLQAAAWGCVWREAVQPGPARRGPEVGCAGALAVLALGAGLMAWPGPPTSVLAAVSVALGLAAAWAWITRSRLAGAAVAAGRADGAVVVRRGWPNGG
jgi:hypothetical protein